VLAIPGLCIATMRYRAWLGRGWTVVEAYPQ